MEIPAIIVGVLVLFIIATVAGLVTGIVIVSNKSKKDNTERSEELNDVLNQFNLLEEQKEQVNRLFNEALEETKNCEIKLGEKIAELASANGDVQTLTTKNATLTREKFELNGEVVAKQQTIDARNSTISTLSDEKTTCDPNTTEKTGEKGAYICRGTADCSSIEQELETTKGNLKTCNDNKTTCGSSTTRTGVPGAYKCQSTTDCSVVQSELNQCLAGKTECGQNNIKRVRENGVYVCKVADDYANEYDTLKNNKTECDYTTTTRQGILGEYKCVGIPQTVEPVSPDTQNDSSSNSNTAPILFIVIFGVLLMIGAGWLLSRRTSKTDASSLSADTKRTSPYPTPFTNGIDGLKTFFLFNTQKDKGDPATVDTIIEEVEANDGDTTVPSTTLKPPPNMLSGRAPPSWKMTAGRTAGRDNYQFGDGLRTLYNKFKSPDQQSESPAPNLNFTVADMLRKRSAVSAESSSRDTPQRLGGVEVSSELLDSMQNGYSPELAYSAPPPNVPTISDPRDQLLAQIRARRLS